MRWALAFLVGGLYATFAYPHIDPDPIWQTIAKTVGALSFAAAGFALCEFMVRDYIAKMDDLTDRQASLLERSANLIARQQEWLD